MVDAETAAAHRFMTIPVRSCSSRWEGRWVVYWADERGTIHQAVLDPWDACWVPTGVQRGFRNADKTEGKIHIIQGQGATPAPNYTQDYSALKEKRSDMKTDAIRIF